MGETADPIDVKAVLGATPTADPVTSDLVRLRRLLEIVGSVVPGVAAGAVLIEFVEAQLRPSAMETLGYWEQVLDCYADRLDKRFLRSKEAAAFVETVIRSGIRLSEERKRELYAAALVNGLSGDRPEEDDRYRMIDTLARLRPAHLRLFAAVRTNMEFEIPLGSIVDLATMDNGYLTRLRPEVSFEILRIDWGDLRRAGLVEDTPIMGSVYPGYARFITNYGFRFDSFTRMPYDDVHPRET